MGSKNEPILRATGYDPTGDIPYQPIKNQYDQRTIMEFAAAIGDGVLHPLDKWKIYDPNALRTWGNNKILAGRISDAKAKQGYESNEYIDRIDGDSPDYLLSANQQGHWCPDSNPCPWTP